MYAAGRAARTGSGVETLQSGLTVWNRQPDPAGLTAELLDMSIGTTDTPVCGSGVIIGGHGYWEGYGGVLRVCRLRTREIHTDGAVPRPRRISTRGGA